MRSYISVLVVSSALAGNSYARSPEIHIDKINKFSIAEPAGWAQVETSNSVVWQVASKGGTELPTCGVVVDQDWSLSATGNENFIDSMDKKRITEFLSMQLDDVRIGAFEKNFKLGGQRALFAVYSSSYEGEKQMSMFIQTIREGKIYTLFCNSTPESYFGHQTKFLQLSDTFLFSPK